MKSLLICTVLFFFSLNIQCQIVNANDATGNPIRVANYDKIEGSPYLNDGDWSSGIVITQTDQYLSDLKIRYNAFEDQLQYLNNGNPFYYENQDLKSFEFSKVDELGNVERFYFKNGFEYDDEIVKKNHIRILYEGKIVKLLSKIEARKQLVTPASYGESDYEQFVITSDYYLWRNGSIEELKLKKGHILKAFPELKGKVKSYFKENLVDLDRTKDIEELFEYIESELNR